MKIETIAAIATPYGVGGIGIIKISGPKAAKIATKLFRKSSRKQKTLKRDEIQSHKMEYGYIVNSKMKIIDEVLLTLMKSPHSYTREDIVEINSHSGHAVLREIFDMVIKAGATPAEPGEFTKRAFLNGRIDLAQAEAVIDIINARTGKAAEVATGQMSGKFSEKIDGIRNVAIELKADIEAQINFHEDTNDRVIKDRGKEIINDQIISPLKDMIRGYRRGHYYRDGLKIAIVGKPNVGKSSLMNCLVKTKRTIVTEIPGTTRDLIEETIEIEGIPATFADMAGLHETEDKIERMGIEKAREYIINSDIILFMIDGSQKDLTEDRIIYKAYQGRPIVIAINKSDLTTDAAQTDIPDEWKLHPNIEISALQKKGIGKLKKAIFKKAIHDELTGREPRIVPNMRQHKAIKNCLRYALESLSNLKTGRTLDLVSEDLSSIIQEIDEILGKTVSDAVLDQIFNKFCVGK